MIGGESPNGQVVLVVAHWDPHSQETIGNLRDWLDENRALDVLLFVVASASDPDRENWPPSAWVLGAGWPENFPVLPDSSDDRIATALGADAFPFAVAVDADGEVVERRVGELDGDDLEELFDAAQGFAEPERTGAAGSIDVPLTLETGNGGIAGNLDNARCEWGDIRYEVRDDEGTLLHEGDLTGPGSRTFGAVTDLPPDYRCTYHTDVLLPAADSYEFTFSGDGGLAGPWEVDASFDPDTDPELVVTVDG